MPTFVNAVDILMPPDDEPSLVVLGDTVLRRRLVAEGQLEAKDMTLDTVTSRGRATVGGGVTLIAPEPMIASRPVLTTAAGAFEVRGASGSADAGVLRLSAGGSVNPARQAFIDIAGPSNSTALSDSISIGVAGEERLKLTATSATLSTSATNGFTLAVRNTSAAVTSSSQISLLADNPAGGLNAWLNSTTRTVAGGVNAATIQNDVGQLRLGVNYDGAGNYLTMSNASAGFDKAVTVGGLLTASAGLSLTGSGTMSSASATSLTLTSTTGSNNAPFITLNGSGGPGNTVGLNMSPASARAGGTAAQILAVEDGSSGAFLSLRVAGGSATATAAEQMRLTSTQTTLSGRLSVGGNYFYQYNTGDTVNPVYGIFSAHDNLCTYWDMWNDGTVNKSSSANGSMLMRKGAGTWEVLSTSSVPVGSTISSLPVRMSMALSSGLVTFNNGITVAAGTTSLGATTTGNLTFTSATNPGSNTVIASSSGSGNLNSFALNNDLGTTVAYFGIGNSASTSVYRNNFYVQSVGNVVLNPGGTYLTKTFDLSATGLTLTTGATFGGDVTVSGTNLNANQVRFLSNGSGVQWGPNTAPSSRIYDDIQLHLWTDDNMYFDLGGTGTPTGIVPGSTNVMQLTLSAATVRVPLAVTTAATASTVLGSYFQPSLAANASTNVQLGVSATTMNTAFWNFTYAGSGNDTNATNIGLLGGPTTLSIGKNLANLTNTSATSYNVLNTLQPNLAPSGMTQIFHGVALSTGNTAAIDFNYAGAGSPSNALSLGFYGNNGIVRISHGGTTQFTNTSDSAVQIAGGVTVAKSLSATAAVSVGSTGYGVTATALEVGDATVGARWRIQNGNFHMNFLQNNGSGTYVQRSYIAHATGAFTGPVVASSLSVSDVATFSGSTDAASVPAGSFQALGGGSFSKQLQVGGTVTARAGNVTGISGANPGGKALIALPGTTPYGCAVSVDASSLTNGKDWWLFSTGGTAAEGQGRLIFRNNTSVGADVGIQPTGDMYINSTTDALLGVTAALQVTGGALFGKSLTLGNNTSVGFMNAAKSARLTVLGFDATNVLRINNPGTLLYLAPDSTAPTDVHYNNTGSFSVYNGLTKQVTISGAGLQVNNTSDTALQVFGAASVTKSLTVGATVIQSDDAAGNVYARIELGERRTADGPAHIDFHSTANTLSTDYELRIIRNLGVNGTAEIVQTGTGALNITSPEVVISGVTRVLNDLSVTKNVNIGESVTAANATRSLNLVSATGAVIRIWRKSDVATQNPSVELLWGTGETPTLYWDFFVNSTGSFVIRDRIGGNNDRLLLNSSGNVVIPSTADANSTSAGALQLSGGIGVAKTGQIGTNLFVGANSAGDNFLSINSGSGNNGTNAIYFSHVATNYLKNSIPSSSQVKGGIFTTANGSWGGLNMHFAVSETLDSANVTPAGAQLTISGGGVRVNSGGLTVSGTTTLGVTSAGALTSASLNNTGAITSSSLTVNGGGGLTVSGTGGLTVIGTGTTTLGTTAIGALTSASLSNTGAITSSSLAVNGPGGLTVSGTGVTTLGTTSTGALTSVSLNNTGAMTSSSLTVNQSVFVRGNSTGQTQISEIVLGPNPSATNRDYCAVIKSQSNTANNYTSNLTFWTHGNASTGAEPTLALTIGSNQSVTLAGDLLVNTNAAVTGSLTIGGATAATQTWVTGRSYLDTTAGDGRYALKTSLAAKQDLINTSTSLNVGSLYINSYYVATESYVSTYYQGKITSSIPITMAGLTATSGNFQGGSLSAGTTTLGTTTINGNMSATGYVVGGTSSFPLYVLNSARTASYTTAFALYQGLNGDTVVNCAAGQQVQFKVGNSYCGQFSSGAFYAANEVQSASASTFRIMQGDYGSFLRNDGGNFYLMATNRYDQYGSFSGIRPFYFNLSNGDVTMTHNVVIGGNIQCNNHLNVNGNVTAGGSLISNNGIISGATGSNALFVVHQSKIGNYGGEFALYSGADGYTVVNSYNSAAVQFKVNNAFKGEINSAGNLSVVGDVTAYSDAKLKENVRSIADATDLVGRLRGVKFDWKRDGRPGIGLIAQEVRDVVPEVVHARHDDEDDDVTLSIAYGNLVAVLVEAVKELSARVEQLETHRKV